MMIEQATVIAYRDGVATVQCVAKQGCGSCSAKAGCGTTALSALAGEKIAPRFELAVDQPLAEGDTIELGIAERNLLLGVFWLYGVPLLTLLATALLFSQWLNNELMVVGAMLLSTLAVFGLIQKRLSQNKPADTPVFIRKL